MPKTLTREQVQAAGARAYPVVNGFATVRGQQARDALDLAFTCEQLYDQLERARVALHELKSTQDIFSRVFGK